MDNKKKALDIAVGSVYEGENPFNTLDDLLLADKGTLNNIFVNTEESLSIIFSVYYDTLEILSQKNIEVFTGGENDFYAIPDDIKDLDDLSDYLELSPALFNILKTLWVNKGNRHTGTNRLREAEKRLYYSKREIAKEEKNVEHK
jgi:hypothetical protein